MSKPIVRVAFVVLISLAVIAATSASAQGRLGSLLQKDGAVSGAVHVDAGLQPDLRHVRTSLASREILAAQAASVQVDMGKRSGHDCDSEQRADPND